jgi:putative nucleotidyltransferase with HDIG domain
MPARSLSPESMNPIELKQLRFSNIIAALSYALDLTEGACPGHAVGTCILTLNIGRELGLSEDILGDAYYAALLKDVGCSSNSARISQVVGGDEIRAKRMTKTTDWTRLEWDRILYTIKHAHTGHSGLERVRKIATMVRNEHADAEEFIRLRCSEGAAVVRNLGFGPLATSAVYSLDEHWDGRGYPNGIAGNDIPELSRLICLAQTLEVFYRRYGANVAIDIAQQRSGHWFDPAMVKAVVSLQNRGMLWNRIDSGIDCVTALEPRPKSILADAFAIDNICVAFAGVVDAKSPYTFMHSTGVERVAARMGSHLKLTAKELTILRRAALLHDIGKLSVSNAILDKTERLTHAEWHAIRLHPHYTFEILNRISGFEQIACIAASHHEKLDGSGYHMGLTGDQLCLSSRILTVADMYDAITSNRPYHQGKSIDEAMSILRKEAPHAIDASCLAALECCVETLVSA